VLTRARLNATHQRRQCAHHVPTPTRAAVASVPVVADHNAVAAHALVLKVEAHKQAVHAMQAQRLAVDPNEPLDADRNNGADLTRPQP